MDSLVSISVSGLGQQARHILRRDQGNKMSDLRLMPKMSW